MTQRWPQLAALSFILISGCALLGVGGSKQSDFSSPLTAAKLAEFESTDRPTRNIVRLETSIISAPDTDKRLRELVWEELDESGLMSPEDRRRLNQGGLRVGVSGGTVPWALRSLRHGERHQLQRRSAQLTSHGQNAAFASSVAIPEGGRSLIEIPSSDSSVVIPPGEIAGLKDGTELQNARRVIELTPIEYGAGWVLIRFLPQIHHGAVTTRYSISGTPQTMPVRQRIQPLYEQQFELKLHASETVVIGYHRQKNWTVGQALFQSNQLASTTEALIAFQLQTVEKVSGEKSLHVDYSKY